MESVVTADGGDVDRHVGARIGAMRRARGMSISALADALEVTPRQIEFYEAGEQRVSASRLWLISHSLGAPISGFFVGLSEDGDNRDRGDGLRDLVSAWAAIRTQARDRLVELARKLAVEASDK